MSDSEASGSQPPRGEQGQNPSLRSNRGARQLGYQRSHPPPGTDLVGQRDRRTNAAGQRGLV
ncbi:protein of unknown function [Streptomyces murinus]